MTKSQRVIVFLVALALVLTGYLVFKLPVDMLESKGIIIISALIMMSFTTLLAEHLFTRPTDVVATTVSILLLLSPTYPDLQDMGLWYWAFWGYNAVLLTISLIALLLLNVEKSPSSLQNRVSKFLKNVAVFFGNGRLLWFALFVLCVLFYVDSQSHLFVAVFCFSAFLLLIDPSKTIYSFRSSDGKKESVVGNLFGIQSSNAYLVKVYPESPEIHRFDVMGFLSNSGGKNRWITGLVIEAYELNAQRWLKILSDDSFQELKDKSVRPSSPERGEVHLLEINGDLDLVKELVGIVSEGSVIEKIKFEYAFSVDIQEGALLELICGGEKILYQLVDGITATEALESRNEAGLIIGEAVQLGQWNSDSRCFDRYGWVPSMNSPISLAKEVEIPECLPAEYQIGKIPGSNFPVFIDKTSAVTHHLAILGVTGSGKSIFARDLIREIAREDIKVICVDFTGEYNSALSDLIAGPLVDDASSATMFTAIDDISGQMDEFANRRDKTLILTKEEELSRGFESALRRFVNLSLIHI